MNLFPAEPPLPTLRTWWPFSFRIEPPRSPVKPCLSTPAPRPDHEYQHPPRASACSRSWLHQAAAGTLSHHRGLLVPVPLSRVDAPAGMDGITVRAFLHDV